MKNIIAMILSSALAVCAAASAQALTRDELVGKVYQYTNRHGQTYWTTYYKDGQSFTKSERRDGKSGYIYDGGHWRLDKQGTLYERYYHWGKSEFGRTSSASQGTLVGNAPAGRCTPSDGAMMTCEDWCRKWRKGVVRVCMYTDRTRNCKQRYGTVLACVYAGPPK